MKDCKTVRKIILICTSLCVILFTLAVIMGASRYFSRTSNIDEKDVVAYIINERFILNNKYSYEQLKAFDNPKDMVNALGDAYSAFMTKDEIEANVAQLEHTYVGLGFEGNKERGKPLVIDNILPSSPSLDSGLVVGDVITKIDGKDTIPMDSEEIISLIRGEEGTYVTLSLLRNDKNVNIRVLRHSVKDNIVESAMMDNEVGYLSIKAFPKDLYKEVVSHLAKLKSAGLNKLIIDLRGNEGGDVQEVGLVLSMLFPYSHNVLYTIYNKGMDGKKFRRENEVVFLGPIIVLCDNSTASCSELFISCLMDLSRAKIIGDVTFGKQTTQTYYHMKSGNVLKLSTGIMMSPNNTYYEEKGITPDVVVKMNPKMSRAGAITEDSYSYSRRMNAISKVLEEELGREEAVRVMENGDVQLNKAYEIIKNTPNKIYIGANGV